MGNDIETRDNIPLAFREEAYRVYQVLIGGEEAVQVGFLQMAKALYLIDQKKYYVAYGYNSFGAFAESENCPRDRSMVYHLRNIYETFVIKGGIKEEMLLECGVARLVRLLPIARRKTFDYQGWVSRAAQLSEKDFNICLYDAKTGKTSKLEDHYFASMEALERMREIGVIENFKYKGGALELWFSKKKGILKVRIPPESHEESQNVQFWEADL